MQIQCECGNFRADLVNFPRNTPGRLACYCDDCQTFLHHLGRADLLDAAGGTEIIPVYPADMKILAGREVLKCTRIVPNGMFRWSTTCCNTPIGNTRPGFPWIGILHRVYTVKDPGYLEKTFGPVKSRIQGRYARGTPPEGTAMKMGLKDAMAVLPFLLKGALSGKRKNSPFFAKDGITPIVQPRVLAPAERDAIRKKLGF